jgi:DNA-binding NarL/FixJ family response regulator
MIRVMIVDDHDFLREAIHVALQGVSDLDEVIHAIRAAGNSTG